MKTFKLGLLIVIMLSVCVGYLFAGGFALSGIGSKAISMGGAFRGMADDPTAMYWNPAGLGFLPNSKISIAGAGIMPATEFQSGDIFPGIDNKVHKADKKLWMFPNLYAVKACDACKLKFGLGAYVPYGLGATWDIYDYYSIPTMTFNVVTPTDTIPTALALPAGFPEKDMKSSIGIFDVHPTVAYTLSDNLSIGAGLSVYYGMIEIDKVKPNSTFGWSLPTTMELEGTGMGFGGNLGLMWKVSDYAQIGLSGKLPAKINLEGEAKIRTWLSNYVNYVMHMPQVNPAAYMYAVPYVLGDTTDIKADLNLPGDIGWGLSLKPNQNWTINADFTYTFWNTLDKIVLEFDPAAVIGTTVMEETELGTAWKDAFRVNLGTQYQMNKVALRGGFFYDETPIPFATLNPTLPDTAEKYSGNVGLGWQLGKWLLDVNYEHIFFVERKIVTQTAENMIGTYNNDVNAFNMGLTYNF
jgi:long-chain fatty acid transport protein